MESGEDYSKRIQKKFDKNPELLEEVENCLFRLSEIYETSINLSLNFDDNNLVDDLERFENYNPEDFEVDNDTITLNNFIDFLKNEDGDLSVSIDPIYLQSGVNNIKDVIITTLNDNVILVPKTEV